LKKYAASMISQYVCHSYPEISEGRDSCISAGLPTIRNEDFNATIFGEEAFFLYLQTFHTTDDERVRSSQSAVRCPSARNSCVPVQLTLRPW
jgi:hypothetical protein